MTIFLRDLVPNQRFMLIRTREMYRYIGVNFVKNRHTHYVRRSKTGEVVVLHHSCHVKPVVRLK